MRARTWGENTIPVDPAGTSTSWDPLPATFRYDSSSACTAAGSVTRVPLVTAEAASLARVACSVTGTVTSSLFLTISSGVCSMSISCVIFEAVDDEDDAGARERMPGMSATAPLAVVSTGLTTILVEFDWAVALLLPAAAARALAALLLEGVAAAADADVAAAVVGFTEGEACTAAAGRGEAAAAAVVRAACTAGLLLMAGLALTVTELALTRAGLAATAGDGLTAGLALRKGAGMAEDLMPAPTAGLSLIAGLGFRVEVRECKADVALAARLAPSCVVFVLVAAALTAAVAAGVTPATQSAWWDNGTQHILCCLVLMVFSCCNGDDAVTKATELRAAQNHPRSAGISPAAALLTRSTRMAIALLSMVIGAGRVL